MIASLTGAVVLGVVALAVPLVFLIGARRSRAGVPDAAPTPRRGMGRFLGGGSADAASEQFLRALLWSVLMLELAVLVSWAAAYASITNYAFVGIELAIALVVLAVGLIYARQRGVGRAATPPMR
jgi:NADH:ubiquinone oxidoreductase subunit 3 (subunit A)